VKSDFSKRMDKLSKSLAKTTSEIAEESFKPTQKFARNGARLPKRDCMKYERQYAFGVSPLLALAQKLNVDPWTLTEAKSPRHA
jgi:hypothetical protein